MIELLINQQSCNLFLHLKGKKYFKNMKNNDYYLYSNI